MNENPYRPPTPTPARPAGPGPWQPRFTILGMMLTTLVVAVMAAGVGYMVRFGGATKGRFGHLIFLLIILAGPLVVVIAVSVVRAIVVQFNRPRKR